MGGLVRQASEIPRPLQDGLSVELDDETVVSDCAKDCGCLVVLEKGAGFRGRI